jgi:hypothetical protein
MEKHMAVEDKVISIGGTCNRGEQLRQRRSDGFSEYDEVIYASFIFSKFPVAFRYLGLARLGG